MFDFLLTVFSLLFRRLNDLVLSLPYKEFLTFFYFLMILFIAVGSHLKNESGH